MAEVVGLAMKSTTESPQKDGVLCSRIERCSEVLRRPTLARALSNIRVFGQVTMTSMIR
jgi:hypothetical protein